MKSFVYLFVGIIFLLFASVLQAQVFDKIVGKEGPGYYRTVQSAIDRSPDGSEKRHTIFVKDGLYEEKVIIPPDKTNISLIGESADGVIISWDDYQGKDGMSAAATYTLLAEGNDLYMENITIRNSAGDEGQAIAIRTTGERQVFKNCRFLGFQDTYYAHKNRQYNLNCTVEGATDFVYGDATAVFEECTIRGLQGGQYISAPADTKLTSEIPAGTFYHGLLFKSCDVVAGEGVPGDSYYLGRPWQPEASSVFIRCRLGSHIKDEGWSEWGNDNHLSGCFAEYQSKNMDGTTVDTSERVEWGKQLTQQEVTEYYNLGYFFKKNEVVWDPLPVTESPDAPKNLDIQEEELTWSRVNDTRGYVVSKNDSVIGFSEVPSFDISEFIRDHVDFSVRSVNDNGNLSLSSDVVTDLNSRMSHQAFHIKIRGDVLVISESADVQIFNMSGVLVRACSNVGKLSLNSLKTGTYIVKVTNDKGYSITRKIVK